MENSELLKRISARPDVFGGKPIIRNMRDRVKHGWDSGTPNNTVRVLTLERDGDALVGRIPFGRERRIRGNICITVTEWNAAPNGDV